MNVGVSTRLFAGLSRRVILKDAETGRTQTYNVSSDVLAQQFALQVGRFVHARVSSSALR